MASRAEIKLPTLYAIESTIPAKCAYRFWHSEFSRREGLACSRATCPIMPSYGTAMGRALP